MNFISTGGLWRHFEENQPKNINAKAKKKRSVFPHPTDPFKTPPTQKFFLSAKSRQIFFLIWKFNFSHGQCYLYADLLSVNFWNKNKIKALLTDPVTEEQGRVRGNKEFFKDGLDSFFVVWKVSTCEFSSRSIDEMAQS